MAVIDCLLGHLSAMGRLSQMMLAVNTRYQPTTFAGQVMTRDDASFHYRCIASFFYRLRAKRSKALYAYNGSWRHHASLNGRPQKRVIASLFTSSEWGGWSFLEDPRRSRCRRLHFESNVWVISQRRRQSQ